MRRTLLATLVCTTGLCGCAVIKTTDVTDASFKRHQSVSLLGWPVYTRITDKEPGTTTQTATKYGEFESDTEVRAAEMLGRSIERAWPAPQEP